MYFTSKLRKCTQTKSKKLFHYHEQTLTHLKNNCQKCILCLLQGQAYQATRTFKKSHSIFLIDNTILSGLGMQMNEYNMNNVVICMATWNKYVLNSENEYFQLKKWEKTETMYYLSKVLQHKYVDESKMEKRAQSDF